MTEPFLLLVTLTWGAKVPINVHQSHPEPEVFEFLTSSPRRTKMVVEQTVD